MIVIIDYGLGNLASISNALNRLGFSSLVSNKPRVITRSKTLILPGVGSAREGMRNLTESSLESLILDQINKGKPLLGICLGMQLLFDNSEEGNVKCLGLLKGVVKKFQKKRTVPQIGWNRVKIKSQKSKVKSLLKKIPNGSYFYFINSYYCQPENNSIVVGTTKYGEEFASMIVKENIVATQFHPEKSGRIGQQLLQNIFRYFNNLNHSALIK